MIHEELTEKIQSDENLKEGMHMKSKKSFGSFPVPSPPMKQTTSLASDRLTRSEIDSLRQGKKQISDFVQKELSVKVKSLISAQH